MIRIVFLLISVTIFLIISLPIQLVVWLLSKKWPTAPDHVSYPLVCGFFKYALFFAGTKIDYIGKERVPEGAVVYVGNHRSFFDIVTMYPAINHPAGFLAKIELKKIPGLNIWMSIMHCIFLDRNNIKKGLVSIMDSIENIKKGISMFVFPEGTRSKEEGSFLEFHDATFKIALKTGCPIVPVAICNTAAIFEDHFPKIKPAHVIVEYLDPINPADLTPEQKKNIGSYVRGLIIEAYNKNVVNI